MVEQTENESAVGLELVQVAQLEYHWEIASMDSSKVYYLGSFEDPMLAVSSVEHLALILAERWAIWTAWIWDSLRAVDKADMLDAKMVRLEVEWLDGLRDGQLV
jgi:hypothetical protein